MNKMSKKPKQKTFNKFKSKSKDKSVKPSKKSPKINKNSEQIEENIEDLDEDLLKQELNEIIKDFNQTNQKSKNKNSSKVKSNDNFKKKTFNDKTTSVENKHFFNSEPTNTSRTSRRKRKLLVRTETKWYELRIFDESVDLTAEKCKYNLQRVQELRREAEELFRTDIENYYELQEKNAAKQDDFQWIRTVLKSGTLADKLSAHTILIQDSAVYNLRSLESMLSMVSTKGKRECIMALDNLRELFVGDLLIPNKKLKIFSELLHFFDDNTKDKKSRNRQLILCLFEEKLKLIYRQFLERLAAVTHDSVDTTKHKSLVTFFDLLVNNGEQEQYLLENLVNKLGDPLPKLAAQSTHLLNQLINHHHPLMKPVVIGEVERLLYRPNIGQRAQYYGLCFLSEVIFSGGDRALANKLIQIYFGFFKACVKKGDIDNKTMSVLLTGVSRAFPYSKLETSLLEDNLETFYKLIHFVNQNTGIQALLLIFNIIDVNQSGLLTDRYYSVLYRHLLDVQLDSCSRKAMFLNLVFKAMKKDPILKRVKAFIKRLLQIALTQSSSLTSSILILISEVIKTKPGLILSKVVIGEDITATEDVDDDGDEHFEDVPLSDDESGNKTAELSNKSPKDPKSTLSWVHNKNIDTNRTKTRHYDPNARNPLFAGTEFIDLWELALMKSHFHPSTSLFAEKILNKQSIDYSGDPINDFSLKRFLDRFVFRNPKKVAKNVTSSTSTRVFGRLPTSTDNQTSGPVTINSKEYVNQPESRIPIDERFIHHYLKQKVTQKTDGYDSDVESVTSVEFESLLDRLEPMSKKDFAKDVYKDDKNKKNKKSEESDEDSDEESDDDFGEQFDEDPDGEDSDMEFDEDDPEFADAFGGVDSELEDALEADESETIPKKRKQGFDRMTNDLFASADEFAQLLEANESDSGLSDAEVTVDEKTEFRNRRKLGRKKKKFNRKDVDI